MEGAGTRAGREPPRTRCQLAGRRRPLRALRPRAGRRPPRRWPAAPGAAAAAGPWEGRRRRQGRWRGGWADLPGTGAGDYLIVYKIGQDSQERRESRPAEPPRPPWGNAQAPASAPLISPRAGGTGAARRRPRPSLKSGLPIDIVG